MITVKGYTEDGSILSTIENIEWTIPNDAGNRLRQQVALWEAQGNTIPPYVAPIPTVNQVSARQFKMQLYIQGILPQVRGWISSQNELIQIAYNESSTFIKGDQMMTAGFTALGFNEAQLDQFFVDASKL